MTVVTAPVTGTILQLQLQNPGQVVSPGEAIAQISPSNAPLLVKARVSAEDISQVKRSKAEQVVHCQQGKVQMRVSAYPYPDYGILSGAVRGISADAITLQNNGKLPNVIPTAKPYYEVTIELEKHYLSKDNKKYPIQTGMEINGEIISRNETF